MRPGSTAVRSDYELDLPAQDAYRQLLDEQSMLSLSESSGLPEWLPWSKEELFRLELLPVEWDGEGSVAPTRKVVQICEEVLSACSQINAGLAAPYIVPAVDGRILLEWKVGPTSLDIEVSPSGTVIFLFRDRDQNVSSKGFLSHSSFPLKFLKAIELF